MMRRPRTINRETLARIVRLHRLPEDSYEDVTHRLREMGEWLANRERLGEYQKKSVACIVAYRWERRDAEAACRNEMRLDEYQKRREAYARLGLAAI